MTSSDWRKITRQLRGKPAVLKKFLKHNKPRARAFGVAANKCEAVIKLGIGVSPKGRRLEVEEWI